MNDIDFDELDKAVSSLIGTPAAKKEPVQPERAQSPVIPPASPSTNTKPSPAPVSAAPPPSLPVPERSKPSPSIPPLPASPTGAASSSAPAVRRGGRFMDVVHPPQAHASPSPRPAATSNTPPGPKPIKPAGIPTPTRVSYTGKKLEPVTPLQQKKPSLSAILGVGKTAQSDDEPLLEARAETHPETRTKVAPYVKPSPDEKHEDLSPPFFLSGTKVEKRPLGKFTPSRESDAALPDGKQKNDEAVKKTVVSELPVKKSADDLPPELDQRVVAVEAGDIEPDEAEDRPDTPPAYAPEPEAIRPRPESQRDKQKEPAEVHRAVHAASQSIPAQYKAKHSETDMTPRPIFDTKDYHQPLTHTQRKSGHKPWVWALFVLLLLAIGAGLGVGAYFLLG